MIQEIQIYGDCLMGIGIPDGGIAIIDRDLKPNVFDVVWCMNPMASINGYLKQIVQTGDKAIVHTCYIDKSKDYQFYAPEILGVVLKVMDYDRNVVWERPEPVEYAPVVHGHWSLRCDSRRDYSTDEWDEDFYLECSECKRKVWDINQRLAVSGEWGKLVEQYPYCHCGAKMDGGKEK